VVALALLAGITAQFIPVIGTYIGVAVPVVVALADKPVIAIWIVVFAIIYQQIETYVFTPKVSQRTMEVNPAIALAAVFLGAAIWGPIGAIIGVPIAAVVASIMETYGRRYELVPHLASQADNGVDPVPNPVAEPAADTDPLPHDAQPAQSGPVDEAGPAIEPAPAQDSEPPRPRG
jgi:predicted PurR-regulated permease PerM